jgi:hypothetical protein
VKVVEKQGYLKNKISELETNSKNKKCQTYRGIRELQKGYQPRTNLVKDENGDPLAQPHNIMNRHNSYKV